MTLGIRAVCLDTAANSVLLVKHTYSSGWSLPGGGVEAGESVLSALQRELSEEVGIECKSAQALDVYHNRSISKRDHVVIYLVDDWLANPEHERPKLEIADTGWFKIGDLPEGLTPCTRRGIELCQQGLQ